MGIMITQADIKIQILLVHGLPPYPIFYNKNAKLPS